ncbi:sensor histidine kinase [Flavobacterium sp.]
MSKNLLAKRLKLPKVFILFIVIFLSCTSLIFINYFTIKILSANRAYVNGESHYSKGQKDAVRYLITYLYTEDASQWTLFKEEIRVPQGDGLARIGLLNNVDTEIIRKEFLEGRNHQDDIDDMIWLFRNFNHISFFKKAINEWEKGDSLIGQLSTVATKIDVAIKKTNRLDTDSKRVFLSQITVISDKLTINEREFSSTLGQGNRDIKMLLIYTNIFFIMIIICSVSIYYAVMVKRLLKSKQEIETKNDDLLIVNKELDRFVYSASHDLRSPINSLKGLVDILKTEENPEEIQNYLNLMESVLNNQDQFIKDIIDYSRNKRTKDTFEKVSLIQMVDDAIDQLQYIQEVKRITIKKELLVNETYSDKLRIRIIINNLLSNAIKYTDFEKEHPFIHIKTYRSSDLIVIEFEDNGIGISEKNQSRIYDMFFVTNKNKGTGLGLYIVKESLDNLKGSITVESQINIGSKFIVKIPYHSQE